MADLDDDFIPPPPPPEPEVEPPSPSSGPPPLPVGVSRVASASTPNSNTPAPPSPGKAGVSQLAAMLQASMLKQPINTSTIPEHDSDSDDDRDNRPPAVVPASPSREGSIIAGQNTHKKMSSASSSSFSSVPTHMKWEIEKANRFGLKDTRLLVLDLAGHAVRFFDGTKLKSEVPLNQIATSVRKMNGEEPRRVEMTFKEDRRSYELYFKNEEEAGEFERLLSTELDTSIPTLTTRQYSQSVHGHHHHRNSEKTTPPSPSSVSALPQHHHTNSLSSGSYNHHTREASESIAIHSEVGGAFKLPTPALGANSGAGQQSQQPVEDHNAYLDYAVSKKNRFGMKQQRILVINAHSRTMLLLDEKRKFKKEFPLQSILSVEIPKSTEQKKDTVEAQCYIVFSKEAGQKPFHLFFLDTLDRLHFCERLVSLAPHELSIKDESDSIEDEDSFRFGILKLNKVGVKKKRIVVLRTKEKVLRSFNREKSYKDVSFTQIIKWEKPLLDRFRLNIYLHDRPHPLILIFPDPVARERFGTQCNFIREAMEQETAAQAQAAMVAGNVASPTTPPTPTASSTAYNPNPPLTIFTGSWNLGNAPWINDSLAEFIPPMKYDLYVIGLQECSKGDRDQWLGEVRNHIQQNWKGPGSSSSASTPTTTAPATVSSPTGNNSNGTDGGSNEKSPSTVSGEGGSTATAGNIEDDKQPYALLGVVKLWEIVMMVLIRRPLASKVTNLCMDTTACGLGDVLGNKGGCGISFTYQDSMNLAFVACHLAARSERIIQRAENYMKILKQLQLGLPNVDILAQMDHVFWLGDLNYRNELEFSEVISLVKQRDWKLLTTYDQLLSQMSKQLVFAGFEEGLVRFAPTYRWERKENQFSNKKFQAPSWTDRVLWHSLSGLGDLKLEKYDSAPNLMGSDHRPVYATFSLSARAPYTGKVCRSISGSTPSQLPPIHLVQLNNPHLVVPDNVAFGGGNGGVNNASGSGNNSSSGAHTMPNPSSTFLANSGGANFAPIGSKSVSSPPPLPGSAANKSAVPPPLPGSPAAVKSGSMLLATQTSSPTTNQQPYQHYSLAAPTPSASVASRPSAAGVGGAPPTPSSKGFTPYLFTPPPKGPLWTPPMPHASLLNDRAPLLGSTKEFSIVLQQVKCTFSNVPRGDFTLTASAPFLQTWPTTTAVSYPFGLEVGCHWDEIVLPPFIHDLYYLYSRHIMFSISVPSLAANTSGVNVEQTGTGTCIGTVSVALGSAAAAIFQHVATMKPIPPASASKPAASASMVAPQFNPFAKPGSTGPPGAGPIAQSKPINPNSPGLTGDQGAYYFIEPIYREGLYAGQMEGRLLFRYKK